jgi:hypothetical protein
MWLNDMLNYSRIHFQMLILHFLLKFNIYAAIMIENCGFACTITCDRQTLFKTLLQK